MMVTIDSPANIKTPAQYRLGKLACTLLAFALSSGCTETARVDDLTVAQTAEANWQQPLFKGLGAVSLPITTSSTVARDYFNQGLALTYAFNHAAADFAFTEATVHDPDCAMCYWGSALVLGPNVNANMAPDNAPRAFVLAKHALSLSSGATQWEQDLISALNTRYEPEAPEDRSELDRRYAAAMREVAARHPGNADIVALSAEALMDLHPWDFWDASGNARPWTPEITRTLEWALTDDPKHIGAIHLYIHAMEQSNQPERAEPYADQLAALAPAAGHLVHMPAHIYMRVGRYHDATLNNMQATVADNNFIQACRSNSPIYLAGYIPHNWHFGWVTAAIEGWQSKAYELADGTANQLTAELLRAPGMAVAQHYLSQPLFAKVRFSDWPAILVTPEPDSDLPYARAIWHYARGLAFVGQDDLSAAITELDALQTLANSPEIAALTFFNREGAPALTAIASKVLQAELAIANGDLTAALDDLQAAVVMEDALPYTEPPEWFFPARHSLGVLQLQLGQADAAESTYLEDLRLMPENGWALKGLANALRAQGKNAEAQAAEARFESAWQHAEIRINTSRG